MLALLVFTEVLMQNVAALKLPNLLELVDITVENGERPNIQDPCWNSTLLRLRDTARLAATTGGDMNAGAGYVLNLKRSCLERLREDKESTPAETDRRFTDISFIIDSLFLYAAQSFHSSREELIKRQQSEIMELSTPVLKIWDGVVALPIIGVIDSHRAEIIMQNLLDEIAQSNPHTAVIDLSGLPVMDTACAGHLLKTVKAAELMGATCVISGIRPHTALTMVALGVDMGRMKFVTSLADALAQIIRAKH
jgi:rsbT co-antagonist protein RsbR